MRRPVRRCSSRSYAAAVAVLCQLLGAPSWCLAQAASGPPKTRTDNVKETLHGVEVVDQYRWLEDQNNPETRAWIDAQNRYTQSILGRQPGRDRIEKRLAE